MCLDKAQNVVNNIYRIENKSWNKMFRKKIDVR